MKRFVFSLESLLQKHFWESDVFRMEKAHATRAVDAKRHELKTIEARIVEYQKAINQAAQEDVELNLARRQVIELYLRHQQEVAIEAQKTLVQAEGVEHQIAELLTKSLQQLKTLEKLKSNAKQEHHHQQLRAEQVEADDHWLARYNMS